ncbi:MAG: DUF1127 domain-containing protein [Inquilinaceae bacterium]
MNATNSLSTSNPIAQPVDILAVERTARQMQSAQMASVIGAGIHSLSQGLSAIIRRVRLINERRRAAAALGALDDHLLADLGMRRGEIQSRLREAEKALAVTPVAPATTASAAYLGEVANQDMPARRTA